jgi:hypothetical protein
MTTRAIKKLTKKDDLKSLAALNKQEEEKEDDDVESNDNDYYLEPKNKFNLVKMDVIGQSQ